MGHYDAAYEMYERSPSPIINHDTSKKTLMVDDTKKTYNNSMSRLALEPFFDKITSIECSNGQITEIPRLPTKLVHFDCHINENLTSLPVLPNKLETLICWDCSDLTSLPDLPNKLKVLYCYGCNLKSLPKLPDSLEILVCDDNRICRIPNIPAKIKVFKCNNNRLVNLQAFPDTVKTVSCANNKLISIPALPDSCNIEFKGNPVYDEAVSKYDPIRTYMKYEGVKNKTNKRKRSED